ncbi:MAG TPA: DUF1847 domain-containing protein [Candidatus Aphodovivens avistercoris]|nr:DUF1847 domain-containing protein [Candidatus Aphodovivens avistercoris]
MDKDNLSCANCGVFHCDHLDSDWPSFCMTKRTDDADFQYALGQYNNDPWTKKVFKAAAEIEGLYYGRLTRVEEICLFAQKIGAKKIGIATCMGLVHETQKFVKVLKAKGIDSVCAIVCKVGGIDKTAAGIPDNVKVVPGGHESTCNPIVQARILNEQKTDLNVIVGLCVGHDTLFIKHSEAPVTYLIVKDRVLAHNPAAALYTTGSYYKRLLTPDFPPQRPLE